MWNATLREYARRLRAYEKKEKDSWFKIAWATANIMNVVGLGLGSLKRKITPKALLGWQLEIEPKKRLKFTRADYESLRRKHAKLHKKLFEEKKLGA